MKHFRTVSILEGISYLVILSVTAGLISREFVFPLGIIHGVLFVIYLLLSLQASHRQGWSVLVWLLLLVAAVVPFAFVAVEVFLRRQTIGEGESPQPADLDAPVNERT